MFATVPGDPPPMLRITTRTWMRDSHDLYDYETQEQVMLRQFATSIALRLLRSEENVSVLDANSRVAIDKPVDYLLRIHCKDTGEYIVSPADKIPDAALYPQKLWTIVRSLPNSRYVLQEGDVIKLGRFRLKVKQLVPKPPDDSNVPDDLAYIKLYDSNVPEVDVCVDEQIQQMQCRICLSEGGTNEDRLICACECKGSIKFVHVGCLQKWINSRWDIKDAGASPQMVFIREVNCELCKSRFPCFIKQNGEIIQIVQLPRMHTPCVVLENVTPHVVKGVHLLSLHNVPVLKLGRGHESDVRIPDVSISRFHATISYDKRQFYLEDHDSKFGTLVAMRRPRTIGPGEVVALQVGRSVVEMTLDPSLEYTRGCIEIPPDGKTDAGDDTSEFSSALGSVEGGSVAIGDASSLDAHTNVLLPLPMSLVHPPPSGSNMSGHGHGHSGALPWQYSQGSAFVGPLTFVATPMNSATGAASGIGATATANTNTTTAATRTPNLHLSHRIPNLEASSGSTLSTGVVPTSGSASAAGSGSASAFATASATHSGASDIYTFSNPDYSMATTVADGNLHDTDVTLAAAPLSLDAWQVYNQDESLTQAQARDFGALHFQSLERAASASTSSPLAAQAQTPTQAQQQQGQARTQAQTQHQAPNQQPQLLIPEFSLAHDPFVQYNQHLLQMAQARGRANIMQRRLQQQQQQQRQQAQSVELGMEMDGTVRSYFNSLYGNQAATPHEARRFHVNVPAWPIHVQQQLYLLQQQRQQQQDRPLNDRHCLYEFYRMHGESRQVGTCDGVATAMPSVQLRPSGHPACDGSGTDGAQHVAKRDGASGATPEDTGDVGVGEEGNEDVDEANNENDSHHGTVVVQGEANDGDVFGFGTSRANESRNVAG